MATARADNEIQQVEADLHEIQPQLQANTEIQIQPASIEFDYSHYFDVDGRTKRKGTFWTATAHIITAVIGLGGVLTLAWAMAQLGWIFGPIVMVLFTAISIYTSILLTHCYRRDDSVTGRTNSYTYTDAVKSILGGRYVQICGLLQYVNICGIAIGFTIAASTSMMAIEREHCMPVTQGNVPCDVSSNSRKYMVIFGLVELLLTHLSKNLNRVSWLSITATIMSLMYSVIGLGLGIAKVAENGTLKGSLTGISIDTITHTQKIWKRLQALGAIAFAYSFSIVLIEIQDTIKSPAEQNTMKRATVVSIVSVTTFYLLCGSIGYATFGDHTPGNLLTRFSFDHYNHLYWLLDIANLAVVVHLIGAYQVFSQPLLAFVENWTARRWSRSALFTEYGPPVFGPLWRTSYVAFTTCIAIALPSFTDIIGLLGAFGFWTLAVYFPITMYLSEKKIRKWTRSWVGHQMLNGCVLLICIFAAIGSIVGLFDFKLKTV